MSEKGERSKKRLFVSTCKTCKHRDLPIEVDPCAHCTNTGWEPRPTEGEKR
jgi:cytochrome c5